MKKIKILFMLLSLLLVVTACKDDKEVLKPIEKIEMNPTSIAIHKDEGYKILIRIKPVEFSNEVIEWKSSNEEIATVDNEGYVSAKKEGEVVISARCKGLEAQTKVQILPVRIRAEKLILERQILNLGKGKTFKLAFKILPENASSKAVEWSSSDESVATVDQEGLIKALELGEVIITAKIDGIKSHCKLTVIHPAFASIIYPFIKWGASVDEIKAFEKENNGRLVTGPKKEDSGEYYMGFKVGATDEVPITYRAYYLKDSADGTLAHSYILYPFFSVFSPRGDGAVSFNQDFLRVMKEGGYSDPQPIPNGFIFRNATKGIWIIVQSAINDGVRYASLDILPSSSFK